MHLTAKFHHLTFNRSEVIMLTNRQTDKQTDAAENIHLARYATPVGNEQTAVTTLDQHLATVDTPTQITCSTQSRSSPVAQSRRPCTE